MSAEHTELAAGNVELDELDLAVREGRLTRVVLESPEQLLAGLWNGEIDAQTWLTAGVEVEFATKVDGSALPHLLLESWSVNARRHRRRRIVAGAVLRIIAIAAAFILLWAAA